MAHRAGAIVKMDMGKEKYRGLCAAPYDEAARLRWR
jgi:hypothetical protein